VGLYHRNEVLQCYNNIPIPKEEKDIILPNHIRIFLDQPLLNKLNTEKEIGEQFYKEAVTKGRRVCWSKKGLKDNEEVEDKWKYDRHAEDAAPTSELEGEEDGEFQEDVSDSKELTMWEDASRVFKECSVVIGLHPDQATEAIVDFSLERKKPFAVIPCCVYHKEFPKRRFPDGTPISKYEDFIDYLMAKDPNIRKTVLDIEGKNIILFYQPKT